MGQHSPKLGQHSPKIGHRPSACHVRKFRWHPPLSFPPPIPTGIAGVRSSTICSKVPVGRSTRAVIRIRERRKGLLPRMPCAVYEQDRSQNISSIRMSKHDIIFWNTRKQKGMRKNRKIPFHSQTNALLPSSNPTSLHGLLSMVIYVTSCPSIIDQALEIRESNPGLGSITSSSASGSFLKVAYSSWFEHVREEIVNTWWYYTSFRLV